ncbi:hypothetical protein ACFQPG_07225 [Sphingomonas sp. GCM10030256]|uniref:hypothetical protein n=1 Tax=Sphingomonas sp. GCM10030256 TaxID=3273427 RepID=UPI0036061B47
MDGAGEGGIAAWLMDVAAALALACACGFAGASISGAEVGLAGGSTAMALTLVGLRRITPEPQSYVLPAIVPGTFPIREPDVLELTEVEPLLLEDALSEVEPGTRVIRLFAAPTMPTAGELVRRIETHLGRQQDGPPRDSAAVVHLEADASAALREALANLRRSIG